MSQPWEKLKVNQMPHTVGLRSLFSCVILHSSPKICFNSIIHLHSQEEEMKRHAAPTNLHSMFLLLSL